MAKPQRSKPPPDLRLFSDPFALQAAIEAERARRTNERSFSSFVRQAWPYVPMCDPLIWGWHLDAMCLHLEEVAHGRIPRLLINIPPGHAKSVLTTVLWPAWIWTWWPSCQFLFASYGFDLATRDSMRTRAVVESDWYQTMFSQPEGWTLRTDQNRADNFANTRGGVRYATSVGGGGLGMRAHIIAIDDPLNGQEAHSKAARERAIFWLGSTISTRFVDPAQPRMCMIMQRLHEEDPADWVLKIGGWEHLMLPSEFDPHRKAVTHHYVTRRNGTVETKLEEFWSDPRTYHGELLFPERFTARVLEEAKTGMLGPRGFATQHQQLPAPEGGGIFRMENWRFWTTNATVLDQLGYQPRGVRPRGCATHEESPARTMELVELEEQIISVDATFRETKKGSFVAIHVWGRQGARRLLLYRVHRRMDFTDTCTELLKVIKLFPKARRKLIEGKANGDAIISTLEKQHGVTGLEAVNPGTASKEDRAHAAQPYQSSGNVELPEGAPWLEEYVSEHALFPNGAHDDDVDAQSQALLSFEKKKSTASRWAALNLDG